MPSTSASYPPEYFDKQDPADDAIFYREPRLVTHIDEGAIAALTALYAELLPESGVVLDLMSSWRSHLPADKKFSRVIGHGMNSAEMADNPQLDEHYTQNLNLEPFLPFEESSIDAVTCAVSVQYLQQPIEVFGDIYRVLKPGGVCIVSFSNRCFPTKAINAWNHSGDLDHISLVNGYFQISAQWRDTAVRIKPPGLETPGDPLFMLWSFK